MSKKVGYKNPPKYTQFKKGQSGNPNGRPKGSRNIAKIAYDELQERVSIQENGATREISKGEAMMKRLAQKGLEGDAKAIGILLNIASSEEQRIENLELMKTQRQLSKEDEQILAGLLAPMQEDGK